jgi:hypothetical protein
MSDRIWREIDAIMGEIEDLHKKLGFPVNQPSDREPFDILSRVERRLLAGRERYQQGMPTHQ